MHRQPVAQRRRRGARHGDAEIEPPDRLVQRRVDDPVAAPGLAAFGKTAGEVQRTALAGAGALDRAVMRVNAAHPHLDPARADQQPVADRDLAGRGRAGHDQPDAGQRKRAVDRQPEQAARRPCGARRVGVPRALAQMLGERGDPVAGEARHREDRRCRHTRPRRAAARPRFRPLRSRSARHAVDLGDDPGDLGDADQFEHVEMFERLRPRSVIGGDDQQHPVDRQHAGQHVRQKPLVPGDIDKPQLGAVRQCRIGEAEIDRQPAPLFLGQAVGVDPGQRAHQRGLAVVDMAGGREDHPVLRSCPASCRRHGRRRRRPAASGTRSAPARSRRGGARPSTRSPRNRSAAAGSRSRRCAAICRAVRRRHRRDEIGGRQRRRQRQIGRDQQRDAAASARNPPGCGRSPRWYRRAATPAHGRAPRRPRSTAAPPAERVALARDHDKRVAQQHRRLESRPAARADARPRHRSRRARAARRRRRRSAAVSRNVARGACAGKGARPAGRPARPRHIPPCRR